MESSKAAFTKPQDAGSEYCVGDNNNACVVVPAGCLPANTCLAFSALYNENQPQSTGSATNRPLWLATGISDANQMCGQFHWSLNEYLLGCEVVLQNKDFT